MPDAAQGRPFVVVVPRRPISLQAKLRRGYREMLTEHARAAAPAALFEGDLYLRIVWFTRKPGGDVDNIIKPISDALTGVVYEDDKIVVKCASEKVDVTRSYPIDASDAPTEAYAALVAALGALHEHVLYIEVGPIRDRATVLGTIDRRV